MRGIACPSAAGEVASWTQPEVARGELAGRGGDCSDYFHFTESGQTPGLRPDRADYGTFVSIGVTPGRHWDATSPQSVVDDILTTWFKDTDHIDELDDVRTRPHLGRFHLSYRAHVTNGDGAHIVEEQAYYDVDEVGSRGCP